MPALDGVRALAVLGVMAYHSGIPFLPAGFLGVDAFFVLSGFLITTLLVGEWRQRGTIGLRSFWGRRARRLLAALTLVVLFVVCYGTYVVPSGTYPDLRSDALATLFYVANWHFIAAGANYFVQSAAVSPLTHTWSLAIEEQFYLLWPLIVLGMLKLFGGRLRPLLLVAVVGTLASATEMAVLDRRGAGLTRLYYGTDTHAQSLLVGVALAVALAMAAGRLAPTSRSPDREPPGGIGWAPATRSARIAVAFGGSAGLVVDGLLWWRTGYSGTFLWQGGFLVADLGTAAVLLAVVTLPRGAMATALSVLPLRYVGRISYGMYLWHFPLFLWLDSARTGLTGYPLFGVRLGATLAVATVSYFVVERPIRRGGLLRRWRAWVGTPLAAGGAVAFVLLATMGTTAAAPSVSLTMGTAGGGSAGGQRVRVLLIGDSTALTLGMALGPDAASYGVANPGDFDQAMVGCGVTEGAHVKTTGVIGNVWDPCTTRQLPATTPLFNTTPPSPGHLRYPNAERWTVWYRHWVDRIDPNVVMILAGRWEVHTRTYDGKWTNILQPAFAAYVKRQLEFTIRLASKRGAKVVLLTAPCYDHGEQPDGQPWPTNTAARLDAYNRLVREAAASYPGTASVFDLTPLVCPGGVFRLSIDGVQIRNPDGIHFAPEATPYLGPRIWPSIVQIGQEDMTRSG